MKRSAIIEKALEEFGQKDYDGASINSIIEKSGTSKGTFYHYFKSKEELYLKLISLAVKEKISYLTETADEAAVATHNIFKIIRSQIELAVKFALARPQLAAFSEKVANESNQEIKKKAQNIIGTATSQHFNQLIKLNIEEKIIRSDIPEEFTAQIFVYMISRFPDFLLSSGIDIDVNNMPEIQETLENFIDFLENGIGCR